MKQLQSTRNILFGMSFCIVLGLTAMAFQDSSKINNKVQQNHLDTIPPNINLFIDLSNLSETIQKSLEIAQKSLKEVDWTRISKEMQESMKKIDFAKMETDIKNSMKEVDWQKMKSEIDRSMKGLDLSKMKMDMAQMKEELNRSIKDFDSEELKKSMEELKKINFDDIKKEMDQVKKEMELNKDHFKFDMEKMKLEMDKVKVGLSNVKEMVNEMEKDGLINSKESINIEYKGKDLYINDKKQSQQASEKYRKYYDGDKFKLRGN